MDSSGEPDNWSAIPGEILGLIAGKSGDLLRLSKVLVRLSAVCRSWNSAVTDLRSTLNLGPVCMTGTGSRSVTLGNPYPAGAGVTVELPESAGRRCWGSPFGWVVSFEPSDLRFSLVNPFTGATIALPSISRSRAGNRLHSIKAFLTANPDTDPDDCLVVLFTQPRWYKSKLALVRPGTDQNWSPIHGGFNLTDLVLSNGQFYGLEYEFQFCALLFRIQFNHRGKNGRVAPRAVYARGLNPPPEDRILYPKTDYLPGVLLFLEKNLVDLNGELCLCVRYFVPSSTVDFKIFKIDLSNGNLTQMLSLGGHCLFLGNNYPFSWKPPRRDLVSNCVFYAYCHDWYDQHLGRPWAKPPLDVEVWDMSRSAKVSELNNHSQSHGPLWILPSPIDFPNLNMMTIPPPQVK